jgi:hypothetical protein
MLLRNGRSLLLHVAMCISVTILVLISMDSTSVGVNSHFVDAPGPVLVLGSGGLIGSALVEVIYCIIVHIAVIEVMYLFCVDAHDVMLVQWLEAHNYEVLHVYNRNHIDLRVPGALDIYSKRGVKFAFFLACEVGGSKYIERGPRNVQLDIIQNNLLIYQTVFDWLGMNTYISRAVPSLCVCLTEEEFCFTMG